ncbi:MAG: hypothetical protein JXA71_08465 [Chitinispirillaceae bacterium]|nr:hypothetical protein [Chitinispirillaceae bacterium]
MRFTAPLFVALFAVSAGFTQDGIYGSFIVGQKFVKLQPLNDSLKPYGVEFPSHCWTLGGEGHVIVAKRFVLGGKGFAFFSEKEDATEPNRLMKISGGLGIGSVGYALLCDYETGIKVYPQLGLGLAPFLFQTKRQLNDTNNSFSHIISTGNDNMTVLEKIGLALDVCVAMDWYMKFIHLLAIIPGLETGPILHAEAGYTFCPGNLRWMRDIDQLSDFHPDMKFDGFYFNIGIGLGITSTADKK